MKKMLLIIMLATVVNVNAASIDSVTQGYQKIDNTQVPVNVLKNVSSRYSGYVLNKSYSSGNGILKLVLSRSGKTVSAFYRTTGQFIKTKPNQA